MANTKPNILVRFFARLLRPVVLEAVSPHVIFADEWFAVLRKQATKRAWLAKALSDVLGVSDSEASNAKADGKGRGGA